MRWNCDCGKRSLKIEDECSDCGQVNPKQKLAISREELEDLPLIMEAPENSNICGQCTQITYEENCPNCGHVIEIGEALPYDPKRVQIIVVANG